MSRKIVLTVAFFVSVVAAFVVGNTTSGMFNSSYDLDVLEEVISIIENNHYSKPEKDDLIEGAIRGVVSSLDDPFSSYFSYEEAMSYQQGLGEEYVGIGVSITAFGEYFIIEEVFKDSPAETVGIMAGDIIISVGDVSIQGKSLYELASLIKGEINTEVTIGIQRQGETAYLSFDVTRGLVDSSSVISEVIIKDDSKIGYIKINRFGNETYTKFVEHLELVEEEEIDSLIIDVRYNGGGLLSTLTNLLRLFLVDDDTAMFSTEITNNTTTRLSRYEATRTAFKDYNIVTLINGSSASASEVFASSMAEHGDYQVFGTKTFGKGTMQVDLDLTTIVGDQIHLTVGKWYTSDGNWVHFDGGTDGFEPTVEVDINELIHLVNISLIDDEIVLKDTVSNVTTKVQKVLNVLGYDLRTDGYFDDETELAIEQFQIDNGITVSKVIDSLTLQKINIKLNEYQDDLLNDSQILSAVEYLIENPTKN
ncbi:hypothetical protein CI105_02055 [Candidatus Izimaplasma bacterium ZiA1]|uniref:S41 family peptidase n=1 Tax=Candidatus Izimoplasma sp. ZiA1 TaxID=2024899 RepID=UPI000BAA86FD|nr:hypothetical protein CI105_02055 [Candidatus Izimaplasma bacterium ZiA1]